MKDKTMSFCKIVEQKMRMIRIKLASRQAALLAGILVLPSAMMGQVSYEYTLPLNGSSSDSIDSGGEEDVYRITVTGSGTLTVHSSGSTDVYGYLLSSSGSELASNDDGGQGRNFQISHSVSAGTYYVRVRHYDSTETGDYTVHSSFTASSSSGGGSSGGGSLAAAVPVLAVEAIVEVLPVAVVPAVAVYLMRRLYLPAVPVPVLLVRRAIKMCIGSQFPGRGRSRFIARVARTHMASC